jgi:hypothetical protein
LNVIDIVKEKIYAIPFFLSISSSWVNLRLRTGNQLKFVWWWWVGVESEFSDQLWLWPSRTIIGGEK